MAVVIALLLFVMAITPSLASPPASLVPARNLNQPGRLDATVLVVEASLNNVSEAAEQLEKVLKDLDKEMNRHEEIESWNGMFGPTAPLYGDYSPFDQMPIGPGLSTDFREGPLLEPRPEVVNKDGAAINQNSARVTDALQSTQMPPGVPDTIMVRWQNLQSTSDMVKRDLQKLNAFLQDPDYDQREVSKFVKQYRDDAVGIREQCKKIAQLLRKDG